MRKGINFLGTHAFVHLLGNVICLGCSGVLVSPGAVMLLFLTSRDIGMKPQLKVFCHQCYSLTKSQVQRATERLQLLCFPG